MSCSSPCFACSLNNFYSCTACDTSVNASYYLKGSFCQTDPVWFLQLAGTCMLALFILFPLFRKRSMVLLRILDIIQMAAYFKYINGFIFYRTSYLYLGMRGMTPWNEGIQVMSVSNDRTVPIFTSDETYVNQLIRIGGTWIGVIVLMLLGGIMKTLCGDSKLQLSKFLSKNIINAVSISYYITIQDISFFCANIFISLQFGSLMDIVFFVAAILLALLSLILLVWQFSIINKKYKQGEQQDKLLHYQAMILYRMDYDMFETYSLPSLPKKQKKLIRYSNLIIVCILIKMGYGVLVASYLYQSVGSIEEEIYLLCGYILFNQLVWYIALPFDCKSQVLQFIINILADLVLLSLLLFPIISNSSYFDGIYAFACLALFGLAILSAFFEIFLNIYSFVPYDLYETGVETEVEDQKLKKDLQDRRKELEQNEKRIKKLKEQHELQLQQLKRKKKIREENASRNDSQIGLGQKNNQREAQSINQDHQTNQQQFIYPIQNNPSEEDEITKYKIDLKKKRRVYDFDRKKPFVYSNELDT